MLNSPQISGFLLDELVAWLKEQQLPAYRGEQIFHWIQQKTVQDFQAMVNLPLDLREKLEKEFKNVSPLELATTRVSKDGTEKYLFALEDGASIETVLIPEKTRQTLCISSQVGCAMGCTFCATGRSGYVRNLTSAEITAQVLWAENKLRKAGLTLSNIVYMGMGEPLANYDAVLKSIMLLNHPKGLNFGARRITISTCGLVPQIKALADEGFQVNLAISLHAATDEERTKIMPVNRRFPIQELLAAADYYADKTGRRISYEYALIADFNDDVTQAEKLADLLKGRLCHVNLIPINPVGSGQERPNQSSIDAFLKTLEKRGIQVSVRKERGTDIEAACGQLRQSILEE